MREEGQHWLGDRYANPLPIRSRGSFHLVSARRVSDSRAVVVITPGPRADRARVVRAFAEVERVHTLLDHEMIPKVSARGVADEIPFLELDCDAIVDGIELVQMVADSGEKFPYEQADALITSVREALQVGHATKDPETSAPVCMGRLGYGNLLFSARGACFVIGFGQNVVLESDDGSLDGSTTVFQAPEVAMGAPPSPTGDYVGLLLLMRSLVPYVDMTAAVGRVVAGDVRPSDIELLECMRWFEQRVVAQMATERASVEEALSMSERIRELLGVSLDREGLRERVAGLVEQYDDDSLLDAGADASAQRSGILGIAQNAKWVEGPDGVRHILNGPQRRIVQALVQRHVEHQTEPLTTWDLLQVGWPNEQPVYEAGSNRVYVTVARLRKRVLGDLLERFDDGYRLVPTTSVAFHD